MSTRYRVALQGFSDFERDALASSFRLAGSRQPSYKLVAAVAGSDFIIADADHHRVCEAIDASGRVGDTIFIGDGGPEGARSVLPRPIDPPRLFRELDRFVSHRGGATSIEILPPGGDSRPFPPLDLDGEPDWLVDSTIEAVEPADEPIIGVAATRQAAARHGLPQAAALERRPAPGQPSPRVDERALAFAPRAAHDDPLGSTTMPSFRPGSLGDTVPDPLMAETAAAAFDDGMADTVPDSLDQAPSLPAANAAETDPAPSRRRRRGRRGRRRDPGGAGAPEAGAGQSADGEDGFAAEDEGDDEDVVDAPFPVLEPDDGALAPFGADPGHAGGRAEAPTPATSVWADAAARLARHPAPPPAPAAVAVPAGGAGFAASAAGLRAAAATGPRGGTGTAGATGANAEPLARRSPWQRPDPSGAPRATPAAAPSAPTASPGPAAAEAARSGAEAAPQSAPDAAPPIVLPAVLPVAPIDEAERARRAEAKAAARAAARRARFRAAGEPVEDHAPTDVLVLDDSEVARQYLQNLLELFGFRVHLAASSAEALKLLAAQPFVAAFLDIRLGDNDPVDGITLCGQIAHRQIGLAGEPPKLLVVSGQARPTDHVRAQLAGCDIFLSKPLSRGDVARSLESLDVRLPRDARRHWRG